MVLTHASRPRKNSELHIRTYKPYTATQRSDVGFVKSSDSNIERVSPTLILSFNLKTRKVRGSI